MSARREPGADLRAAGGIACDARNVAGGDRDPAGPGGDRGKGRLVEVQRARLLGAMVQEVAEHGVANVSVASVVARAGVSRRTFYELYEDREECFLAAFEDALRAIQAVVLPAYAQPGAWRARIRAGLVALLDCLQSDRQTARLLIVESLAAGPRMLARRQEALAPILAAIEAAAGQSGVRSQPPPLTPQGILGGVLALLHERLIQDGEPSLLELAGPLMAMIVFPYLGAAAARRELELPPPVPSPSARRLHSSDSLGALPMRLTYRTIRTLSAIATRPGSSNRHIGELSEIADQGQVSKLLNRLQRLGLIENAGPGATTRGEANAWVLTSAGRQIHDTIANART